MIAVHCVYAAWAAAVELLKELCKLWNCKIEKFEIFIREMLRSRLKSFLGILFQIYRSTLPRSVCVCHKIHAKPPVRSGNLIISCQNGKHFALHFAACCFPFFFFIFFFFGFCCFFLALYEFYIKSTKRRANKAQNGIGTSRSGGWTQ